MKTTMMAALLLLFMAESALAQRWIGLSEDSVFIAQLLEGAKQEGGGGCLPLYFARKFIGKPYVAHTLEVGDDRRVVVNTRQLDCTTLVENVAALTLCASSGRWLFKDYIAILAQLRYRGGRMEGYTWRLHYFTDWIRDNSATGVVTERQKPNPPFSAVQTIKVGYMTTHPTAYKALKEHPEYVKEIAKSEKALNGLRYRYIPKSKVQNTKLMRSAVKDGDIIAITCNKAGLEIAHLGFAVWRKDGLHLLNASMIHKKVVEEPMTLYRYLQKHKSHTGIRIIKINN